MCGGGRYDGLAEALGGPSTPGIGFGMGIERLLLACDAEDAFPVEASVPDVWVVDVVDGRAARDLTDEMRRNGIAADRSFDARSIRSQMRAANRSGARLALISGEQELADDTVSIRDLRAEDADQQACPRSQLVETVAKLLDRR